MELNRISKEGDSRYVENLVSSKQEMCDFCPKDKGRERGSERERNPSTCNEKNSTELNSTPTNPPLIYWILDVAARLSDKMKYLKSVCVCVWLCVCSMLGVCVCDTCGKTKFSAQATAAADDNNNNDAFALNSAA